jgi:Na+/glutamate symporter
MFGASPAFAQSFDQFDQGAKSAGKSIVSVIVNVIFIILALACVGYGVAQLLAGKIGLFVLCIVGAVVLALAPEFIAKTFQATNSSSLIRDR